MSEEKKTRLERLRSASEEDIARLILSVGEDAFCSATHCIYWSINGDDCPYMTGDKEDACLRACVDWLNSVPGENDEK